MTQGGSSHAERIAWLRLARTPGIGPVTIARLIHRYSSAADALDALPGRCRAAGRALPDIPAVSEIEAELEQVERAGARLLTLADPDYPAPLAATPAPPPVIILRGRMELLERPMCAMVGARNASVAGLRFARELANGLSRDGVTIVSGLARGIDGSAHQGALDIGTVAVVAGGIDHIYPPEHADLQRAIAEDGVILSERPLGTIPTARDFPRRNRLISGLSRGTLVVEAAMRSGSLITARYAAEQGREVMAVPGSPIDPRAKGSNQLLRDGAHLIESVEDVLDVLANTAAITPSAPGAMFEHHATELDTPDADLFARDDIPADPAPAETEGRIDRPASPSGKLLDLLSSVPVSADELARQAGMPVGQVHALLTEMEISGDIDRLPGGLIQRGAP